jgi:4-hydroxybenzoate polyprenyltransferase
MRSKNTIWDYIFLTRPILLIPLWTLLLLGYYRAGGERFLINSDFLSLFLVYTLLISAVYILNQIMDIKSDAINKKHLLLAEGLISVKSAYIEFTILLVAALALMLRLSLHYVIFLLISFLFGIIYSIPPIKFKDRPILDFVINAIGYGFLNFSLGWLTEKPFSAKTVLYSLPYVFAVGAIFINTTILDIEGDKKAGSNTTGVFLSQARALKLSTVFIILCVIITVVVKDWICFIPSIIALPIFVFAAVKKDIKYIFLSIGIGGPLLVLITGVFFPYFLALFLGVFIFLRLYYRTKFGINYPSLSLSG